MLRMLNPAGTGLQAAEQGNPTLTELRNTDRSQTIRMRRFLMAAASYALWALLSLLLYYGGFLRVIARGPCHGSLPVS